MCRDTPITTFRMRNRKTPPTSAIANSTAA